MKYAIDFTSKFKKQRRKIIKQGKDMSKLNAVVEKLANGEELESKYKNHTLINDKNFKDCNECHIEPDWLLIYKYVGNATIILLFATGSNSELFGK